MKIKETLLIAEMAGDGTGMRIVARNRETAANETSFGGQIEEFASNPVAPHGTTLLGVRNARLVSQYLHSSLPACH